MISLRVERKGSTAVMSADNSSYWSESALIPWHLLNLWSHPDLPKSLCAFWVQNKKAVVLSLGLLAQTLGCLSSIVARTTINRTCPNHATRAAHVLSIILQTATWSHVFLCLISGFPYTTYVLSISPNQTFLPLLFATYLSQVAHFTSSVATFRFHFHLTEAI